MERFDDDFPTQVAKAFFRGAGRTTDGPQEGHPGELGRPSEANSGQTGQTRRDGNIEIVFGPKDVVHIYCRDCGGDITSLLNLINHSCR